MYAPRHLRPQSRLVRFLAAAGVVGLLVPGVATLTVASADAAAKVSDKVTICHATTSDTNPYITNQPDKSGDVSGHADHTGPVWNATLKKLHITWGDIIPPFDYVENGVTKTYPGLNWTAAGQAIFANGCAIPKPALTTAVVKTNDADGNGTFSDSETSPTAGAAVPFRVTVTNTGPVAVVVTSLSDVVGATAVPVSCATALVGQVLAPAASATCAFTAAAYSPAAGTSKTNTATVVVAQTDDATNTVTGSDTSTVATAAALPPVPPVPPAPLSVSVVKTNDADGNGTFSPSETALTAGVSVPFRAVVTNTGTTTVALTGLTDAVGTAAAVPVSCSPALPPSLPAGGSATCAFALTSPAAGTSVTDVVTATVADPADATRTATATGSSTVATAALTPPANNPPANNPPANNPPANNPPANNPPANNPPANNPPANNPPANNPPANNPPANNPPAAGAPDLAVTKTGPATVRPGGLLTWTLTVTNTGDAAATQVQLSDALPTGVRAVTGPSAAGWTCSGTTSVSCTLGSALAAGASASVQVSGTLAEDYDRATVVNTAVVGPADATPGDNTATATTKVVSEFTGGGGGTTVDPPATVGTPTSGGGGGGVTLPMTGAPVDTMAALAGWLLAAGAALVLAARRRTA